MMRESNVSSLVSRFPIANLHRKLGLRGKLYPAARAARRAANSWGVGMGARFRPANMSRKRPTSSAWISPFEARI